ncbi:uncharacterized protein [Miscanthus floridulus]|uniref:uncharacterized protein n=1 Tax=Miscanthus floridulus TaxID=154761 RepID=UPI0034597A8E
MPSFESDLEVNLEDDLDHQTASKEEPEPLPVEEVIFNSLEMARKKEEDWSHRAIMQKETNYYILKRVIKISKEEERHHEEKEECRYQEEEHCRQEEETEQRLVMDTERHLCRAERKKRKEEHR